MMLDCQAMCACLDVEYKPGVVTVTAEMAAEMAKQSTDSATKPPRIGDEVNRDRWQCKLCGQEFLPAKREVV